MGILGLSSPLAMGKAAVLPLLASLGACATVGTGRTGGPADDPDEVAAERGPRVQIWASDEFGTGNRIRPSFRLEEDAYVVVVNVALDGRAEVIFPESPEDDGFMRGGRTYRLPAFFPGFANTMRSRYGRLYNATSAYDDVFDRYAGYVFIIASWRPMHFQLTEALGLWDDYYLSAHEEQLEPYTVMHRFADQLVPGRTRDYTARFARYAAFPGGFTGRRSFASCAAYGWPVDFPVWAISMYPRSWVPVYGLGLYSTGAPGCGLEFGRTLIGFRPPRGAIVVPPVRPTPPAEDDTATTPRHPRQPRPPVVASDSSERKEPEGGGRRVEVAIEEEPIIDVTRESRDLARRRDQDAERIRRGVAGERGYERPGSWSRSERSRRDRADVGRSAADVRRDAGDNDGARVRQRAPIDDGGARTANPREGSRSAEPRRDAPSRPEPRSQPAPRSDPPPRSEPAARPEPRGERPAKPVERQ